MALAISNVRRGAFGDLKITAGDWTGSLSDASGTITVEGGRVYLADFNTNDATGPNQKVPTTWSAPTGTTTTTTVTVHNREAVTAGTFIIIHA